MWGDYFHDQRVKLRIANVGNGRQTRVHLESTKISAENGQGKQTKLAACWPRAEVCSLPTARATVRGGYVYYVAEYDTVLDLNLTMMCK